MAKWIILWKPKSKGKLRERATTVSRVLFRKRKLQRDKKGRLDPSCVRKRAHRVSRRAHRVCHRTQRVLRLRELKGGGWIPRGWISRFWGAPDGEEVTELSPRNSVRTKKTNWARCMKPCSLRNCLRLASVNLGEGETRHCPLFSEKFLIVSRTLSRLPCRTTLKMQPFLLTIELLCLQMFSGALWLAIRALLLTIGAFCLQLSIWSCFQQKAQHQNRLQWGPVQFSRPRGLAEN